MRPFLMMPSRMRRAVFDGMAKLIPCHPPVRLKIAELMPMISPRTFSSGPPELPWFTAASCWMCSMALSLDICRPFALTMPRVTLSSRPYGLPTAKTCCPTRSTSIGSRLGGGCA